MRRALRTIKLFSSFFILLKVLQGLYRPDAVVALCRNGELALDCRLLCGDRYQSALPHGDGPQGRLRTLEVLSA